MLFSLRPSKFASLSPSQGQKGGGVSKGEEGNSAQSVDKYVVIQV